MPSLNCANAHLHPKIAHCTSVQQDHPKMSAFNKWSVGSVSMPAFLPVTPRCTFMPQLKCNKSLFSPHNPQIVLNKTQWCQFFFLSVFQNKILHELILIFTWLLFVVLHPLDAVVVHCVLPRDTSSAPSAQKWTPHFFFFLIGWLVSCSCRSRYHLAARVINSVEWVLLLCWTSMALCSK